MKNLAGGVHRPGDPPLAAVDDVLVTVALDPGGDVGGVGGRDRGLGHRKRGPDATVEQRLEPACLLLLVAEEREDLHVAGVGGRAVHRRRGEVAAAAGDLGEGRVLQVGQAGTRFAREEEVPQAALARLGTQLDHDRGAVPGPAVVELGKLVLEELLGRMHVAVHEVEQLGAQLLGADVVLELHQAYSFMARRPPTSRTGTSSPMCAKPSPTVCPWV